jgi:hypothetical protein
MLVPNHREHLIAEGFTVEQIDRLITWGVRTIATPKEAHAKGLSRYATGIWFPFKGDFGQLRVNQPKPESPKYLSPTGAKSQAWTPPGEKPMVVTEGFKDGAIGTLQGGIATGAIAGVSHYRQCLQQDSGQTIVFDADGWTNSAVFTNLARAAQWVNGKVALVPQWVGEKAGLVEYLKAGHSYEVLLQSAMTAEELLLELPTRWVDLPKARREECIKRVQDLAADLIEGSDRTKLERRLSAVAQRAIVIGAAPAAKVSTFNPLARPTTAPVPLEVFISKSNHQLLVSGTQCQRKVQGYNLAADLVGVANALETIGQAYQGNPEGLLREYGARCEPRLSDREVQTLVGDAKRRGTRLLESQEVRAVLYSPY